MGNLVSGCGAVELIASLLGVNRGLIPPTLNCDELDPACGELDLVTGRPAHRESNLPQHEPHPAWPGRRGDRPWQPRLT